MPTLPYLTDTSTQLSGTYTTSAAALDNFVSSNYVNLLSSNNSNYTSNASNVLQTNINTTNTNLTATNTNLANNYYNKTSTDTLLNAKEQILSFTAPLTRSTNTIGINLGSYSTSGSDTAYVLKAGSTMTGTLTVPNITLGSGGKINSYDDYHYIQISQPTDTLTIQEYGTISFNIGITKTQISKINSTGLTVYGICTATTFAGSGASLNNVPYTALTGTVPFYTKAEEDALLLTNRTNNSNYTKEASNVLQTNINTTNTNITNNYYTKTSTDNLLVAKEQILTFSAPLTRTTNTIGINLGSYSTSGSDPAYVLKTGSTMTGNLTTGIILTIGTGLVASTLHLADISTAGWKLQTGGFNLTFTNDSSGTFATKMTLTNAGNLTTVGTITGTTFSGSGANLNNIPYTALTGTVPFYTKTEADTLLNAKEQILTFSSPLTRTTNTIGINLSAYSTSGTDAAYVLKTGSTMTGTLNGTTINATTELQEAGASLTSKYLKLDGTNTMTARLNFNNIVQNNVIALYNAATPNNFQYVGIGANNGLVLSCFGTGDAFKFNVGLTTTTSKEVMRISGDGAITINSTDGGNLITLNTTSTTITSTISFKNSGNNFGFLGLGCVSYPNNYANNIYLEATNDIIVNPGGFSATPKMIIKSNGNVGIGILNPNCRLYISANLATSATVYAMRLSCGASTDGGGFGTLLGLGSEPNGWSKCAIGHTRMGNYDRGDIIFLLRDTSDGADCTMADEKMRIIRNGNVGIGTNSTAYALDVYTNNTSTNNTIRVRANTAREASLILERSGISWQIFNKGSGYPTTVNNLSFSSSSVSHILEMTQSGNVGIGIGTTITPTNILQVGDGARLRISNGIGDYSLIGTKDVDNATNTRIVISGNTRGSGFAGNIDYLATSTGSHTFYTTDATTVRMSINSAGLVSTTGNIACGGGISLVGGEAFYNPGAVTATNRTNTFLSFRGTGVGNDWAYLRNIGGDESIKLALDFHDDNDDARFCIRCVQSAGAEPDNIKEVFTVDNGNTTINGEIYLKNDVWHRSMEGAYRLYFGGGSGTTFLAGGNTDSGGICTMFMSGSVSGYANLMSIYNNGNIIMGLSSTNSAFLIVHGPIACRLFSVNKTNTDYVGTQGNRPSQGSTVLDTLCNLYDTFTGMHRCFTEDELYNKEDPQKFKDDYVGRIVISTGKIATDLSNENNGWDIYYDKDGITQEDAVPMIELSRKKKDKRVFGVMGSPTRKNSRAERMIINSIGEGPILVCNCNGLIENGDYITSSDYLGYGERQDDDLLHNYTVAKATMDCSFELDSPYYNCFEIEDLDANGVKLRVALIACTYHSG